MKVKSNFKGKKVIFQGKEVFLNENLDKTTAQEMVNSGLKHYFENPRGTKKKAAKPTNIKNLNAKKKAKKDASTDKGATDQGTSTDSGK
jgi:hypothetical protein